MLLNYYTLWNIKVMHQMLRACSPEYIINKNKKDVFTFSLFIT